ncbi:mitochondral 37S ribosomal protein S27 [Sticta canariensis]|nr:mitochondral 37S ribosomal protein S27 [Sticta canariensis]
MAVARSRILDLLKIQCRIFSMTYNPERLRAGNKILRERLKGPSMAEYYPRKVATIKKLRALYPDMETWDDDEEDRLEALTLLKARGKGAPKKRRTKDDSKKFKGKKKPPAAIVKGFLEKDGGICKRLPMDDIYSSRRLGPDMSYLQYDIEHLGACTGRAISILKLLGLHLTPYRSAWSAKVERDCSEAQKHGNSWIEVFIFNQEYHYGFEHFTRKPELNTQLSQIVN